MTGPADTSTRLERIVVAVTGASGSIFGVRALELLRPIPHIETHLIISPAGRTTIGFELDRPVDTIEALADVVHGSRDISASISSGSFATGGMIVAPCSIKTLSAVANSYSADLVARAADVTLKERRPLVLMVRETPLHAGHLRLMRSATEAGAVVFPPVPALYTRPASLDEMVTHTTGRALEQLGIEGLDLQRWHGG